MRSRSLAALTATALVAGVAHADVVDNVSLMYQSGATLNGTLVLSNDFSSVVSLDGRLSGYDPYLLGFQGTGFTDVISGAFPVNLGTDPGTFFTLVFDGTYNNFIDFGYSFDSTGITLSPITNDVNFFDPVVSASVTSVPEPTTSALLALGLFSLVATRRRWTLNALLG